MLLRFRRAHIGKRVRVDRGLHLTVGCMGIYFSCSQIFMTQNVLKHADIHIAIPIHKRCGSVPELMDRISGAIQSNLRQILFYDKLHCLWAYPLLAAAEKQRVSIYYAVFRTHCQIAVYGVQTGLIKVDDALFIAFSKYALILMPTSSDSRIPQFRNSVSIQRSRS